MSAKYTDAEVKALGAKGQAFKNPDGSFSYPIADAVDLGNAIKAVGRGGADHDAIRKYIIGRAKALGKSSEIPDGWGSDGSMESKAAGRDPKWEQRRKRWAGSLLRQPSRRSMRLAHGGLTVRAKPDGTGGTNFQFLGYGSTFDDPFPMWDPWGDPYDEEVQGGSFTETLGRPDLDVPFLVGHNDAGVPMARTRNGTMHLSEDAHGLHTDATLSGRRSDVRDLADAVERGDMDEMSIGFMTLGQEWSPDWSKRTLTNLDLHRGDVSVVALAANPATRGVSMTALPVTEAASAPRQMEYRTPTQPYSAHTGETNECVQCHSVNDDTAQFCDQCGTQMMPKSHVSNMAGVEDMTQACPCGKWNSADAKFCGQCGNELTATTIGSFMLSDGKPLETRAQDEVVDTSKQPDFNLPDQDPANDGKGAKPCPHGEKSGCKNMCAGDAKFCSSCGGSLYQGDGTMVLDDSGVVEEVSGAMADADLLMHTRMLELA